MAATHESSIGFSQQSIYDWVETGGNRVHNTRSTSTDLPERKEDQLSNKQRKAKNKSQRKKRSSLQNVSRNLSGDSSTSKDDITDNTSHSSPPPTRPVTDMLDDALRSSQSAESNQSSHSPAEELTRNRIYIEYLENALTSFKSELTSFKSERDILHSEIDKLSKSTDKLKKSNRKLTVDNDKLRRDASKHSNMRRFTDVHRVSTQTDPIPTSELQEATDLAIAKYNSVCDHVTQVANSLLNSVADARISISPHTTASPVAQPPSRAPEPFIPVRDRRKQNRPVAHHSAPQPIPVITTAQVHNLPTYSDAVNSSPATQNRNPTNRPGQGARNRKKTIIIGSSLTDGLSAELNKHNVNTTTFIHRGGLLDEIRARVPNFFSKDTSKQPEKVFLLAGGNDAEASTADRTINAYDGLIREVRKACPRAKIIVSSIPPRKNNSIINGKIKEVNDYLKDRGQHRDNVQFVDVVPTSLDMFTYKKVHFNSEGKSSFATRLKSYLLD